LAGPFSQDFIESVRNAGDIVRLVSDYVPLKSAGSRMKGLCPFHEEKTPSFSVDPTRQLFYCFGCQTGGDLFKFVMLYENVGFSEAAETLGRRFGVPIPEKRQARGDDRLTRLLEMNRVAEEFFKSRLADSQVGAVCREYLRGRRIDDEVASKLGVGHAPDTWEALRGHLISKRFKAEEILAGGLALPRKGGSGEYDRFRNRLMFPIRDVNGRTVAFGGRAIGDAEPKYINSPETPTYKKKGDHLYGLDLAKAAIRKKGMAIVVEGYLDVAALVQAGFENVVASLGTAFGASQAKLLARFCNRIAFSYDGDAAGAAATERSLDLLLSQGFEVRVVELPGGQDPDDYIGEHGADGYAGLLNDAPEYIEFLIRREGRKNPPRVDDKIAAINVVLPHLARLPHAIARADWAGRLADAVQVDTDLVMQELRSAVRSAKPGIRGPAKTVPLPRDAEARLVSRLLTSEQERERWCSEIDPADLEGTAVQPIVKVIIQLTHDGRSVDYPTVLEELASEDDREWLTQVAFRDEPDEGPDVEDCLWALRRGRLKREGRQVGREIRRLQKDAVSAPELDRQLERLQELARQRDALS